LPCSRQRIPLAETVAIRLTFFSSLNAKRRDREYSFCNLKLEEYRSLNAATFVSSAVETATAKKSYQAMALKSGENSLS
jgi:hypothetical protein